MLKLFNIIRCSKIVQYVFGNKVFSKKNVDKRFIYSCDIPNIEGLLKDGNSFDHPVGIVISRFATIGKNNRIYQNVTIGASTVGGVC